MTAAPGHPAYETVRPVTAFASVLLQRNPGPMTLDGTNTWLLRAPGSTGAVVVDPGEASAEHLDRLVAAAPGAVLVLITHRHPDHTQAAADLHARTGVPVRAADPAHCHGDGGPLTDGEVIEAAGLRIEVLATPGHTSDSVCLLVHSGGDPAAVLTGDTILGRGTTVVAHPDGDLGDYLDSLDRLAALGGQTPGPLAVLPGHGPELPDLATVAQAYRQHRAERLDQVRAALAALGRDASARAVVERVYADVDPALWPAAEQSTAAALAHLRGPQL